LFCLFNQRSFNTTGSAYSGFLSWLYCFDAPRELPMELRPPATHPMRRGSLAAPRIPAALSQITTAYALC
jgi:hypothetical protein